jgi:S1-C subfamily serine protease
MLSPAGASILLTAAVFFAGGCTHVVTPHERRKSFAPHETAPIGAEPSRSFLLARTAVLIGGAEIIARNSADGKIAHLEAQTSNPGALAYGSATVIDRRGYLLTAAHCVAREPIYVLFGGSDGIARLEKTTVVWQGDDRKKEPDLAVLRVSQTIESVFEWSHVFQPKDAGLAAGLDYDQPLNFDMGCVAGKITRINRPSAVPGHEDIYHDAPLHGGDSGGPLTSRDGRLIGINVAAGSLRIWPFLLKVSIAQRPNLAWLQTMIDADFAGGAEAASAQSAVSR